MTYCEPEVASVGLTDERAQRAGHDVKIARESFRDSTRAFLEGERHGLVKLVADARTGEILGGHIVGPDAGELIHQVVALMAARATPDAPAYAIHAYPTLSQSLRSTWLKLTRS